MDLLEWWDNLICLPDFWIGSLLWVIIFTPIEMLVHELGHFFMQRKFGMKVKFIKLGFGKLFSWRLKCGTQFIIGIPVLVAESKGVGDGADWKVEKNNPESFSFIDRHPRERFLVSIAGSCTAMYFFTVMLGLWSWFAIFTYTEVPFYMLVVFGLVILTEVSNLCLPIKFSAEHATDSWLAIESLWQWLWWKPKV